MAVLGAEQILAPRAAAAPVIGRWGRAAMVGEEGHGRGRRAVIGREAVSEDGRLDVAQEQCIMVYVVQSGVCHGQNTVTFTCREKRRMIVLDVMNQDRKMGESVTQHFQFTVYSHL